MSNTQQTGMNIDNGSFIDIVYIIQCTCIFYFILFFLSSGNPNKTDNIYMYLYVIYIKLFIILKIIPLKHAVVIPAYYVINNKNKIKYIIIMNYFFCELV